MKRFLSYLTAVAMGLVITGASQAASPKVSLKKLMHNGKPVARNIAINEGKNLIYTHANKHQILLVKDGNTIEVQAADAQGKVYWRKKASLNRQAKRTALAFAGPLYPREDGAPAPEMFAFHLDLGCYDIPFVGRHCIYIEVN